MSEDQITDLVAGRLRDPASGKTLRVPARAVVIDHAIEDMAAEVLDGIGLGRRLAVVSDTNTRDVSGARIERALGGSHEVLPLMLPGRPHADDATVAKLREASAQTDALLAVGSGTLCDLCKYASFLDGKPFAVVATAPSMNGYTSTSAAITVAGHKKSLPAHGARAVLVDLDVVAAAPVRLIRAGLGDSLCRSTAESDWLLAHLVKGTPYSRLPYDLLAADEPILVEAAAAIVAGDAEAIAALVRTLVLSGFGMTLMESSAAASQGEHLISHYVEMMGDPAWPQAYHGEQIAVATLSMARLQAAMLDGPPPRPRPTALRRADFEAHFGDALGASCRQAFAPKVLDAAAAEAQAAHIATHWDDIRARVTAVRVPAARLERALAAAGAPLRHADLGWPKAFYRDALRHARLIRDRWGFLDLAAESGLDPGSFA